MKLKIKRVTLSGSAEAIAFENQAKGFLVKNFSEAPVYVSFDEEFEDDEAIMIEAGYWQICVINENENAQEQNYTNIIYVKGTGDVEIQLVNFR